MLCFFLLWAAECVPDRTDVQCLHRWQKVLNPDLVKGPWKREVQIHKFIMFYWFVYGNMTMIRIFTHMDLQEDDLIRDLVGKQGIKKWSEIAKHLPGRIGKQCRERYLIIGYFVLYYAYTSLFQKIKIKRRSNK